MHTKATSIFNEYDRLHSDVVEVRYSFLGLYIVVETYPKGAAEVLLDGFRMQDVCEPVHIEIFFRSHSGYFLLDESDMPSWLGAECFKTNHIIYNLTEGGWFDSPSPKDTFLQIASATDKEWLVVTANVCVSVFSSSAPRIRELSV